MQWKVDKVINVIITYFLFMIPKENSRFRFKYRKKVQVMLLIYNAVKFTSDTVQ